MRKASGRRHVLQGADWAAEAGKAERIARAEAARAAARGMEQWEIDWLKQCEHLRHCPAEPIEEEGWGTAA